jgi:hypothetical protein
VNAVATDNYFVYSISDDSTFRVYSKTDWSEFLCLELDMMRIESMTIDVNSIYISCSDGSIRLLSKNNLET